MKQQGEKRGWSRLEMAQRAAQDIPGDTYVNLGVGMPEMVAQYIPEGREVIYHTENGLLGMGPGSAEDDVDLELINAGNKPVTAIPGACYFNQADSFAMIRGGHLDICVLGAMQVAENGDLANWSTGAAGAVPSVGGAMDLVAGVKRIFIITQHCTKHGESKLLNSCTYPLTGKQVVSRVYTDLAVLDVTEAGFQVVELAPGVDFEYLQSKTEATLVGSEQSVKES